MPSSPPPPLDQPAAERLVIEIVRELTLELAGGAARLPELDDSLDRDLGISSLERVELLLRLERASGVRLPDAVMAEAQTVRALADALRAGAPAADEPTPSRHDAAAPAAPIPAGAVSLVDALRWHADRTPERPHILLRQDDGSEVAITYGDLLARASAVAAGLADLGVAPGDTVVLMLRTEEAFFPLFLGTLLARAIPVPIYPPVRADQLAEYVRRQQAVVRDAGARVLVTFPEAERIGTLIQAAVPSLETVTTIDRLPAGGRSPAGAPGADLPALIQYTSGSTGSPKGVLLTQANLMANVRAIGDGLAVQPGDVCVSWLPLYHDMGLIGAWLAPLYFGVPVAIMSPLAFLARPSRWLRAIQAHRGTVSPAPNFAYDLAARRIPDDEIEGLDLSSWRLALNGAEMVSPETIQRFTERFAPYGFRPQAMCPVYGLAECSVGLTMTPPASGPHIDRIAREPFEREREVREAPPDDPHPLRFVSCGRPLPGHDVRIADARGAECEERHEGRVQFRGPSMTHGYFRNPAATAAVMHDGWMDTGDLGYRAGGHLFITGRAKDVIIQGGRNVTAQEVEDAAAAVPGVRRGCVAAFGVYDDERGTERLVIVAETRERDAERREAIRRLVVDRVAAGLGTPPDAVAIVSPGSVLKTSSGKIRRAATRDSYMRGTLEQRQSAARQWAALAWGAARHALRRSAAGARRAAFTGRVGVALIVTLLPLWLAMRLTPLGPRARAVARTWARLMFVLSGVRPEVRGAEHVGRLQPALLAANHASYLDPVLLMATIPGDVRFVAKRRLTEYPVLGTVIARSAHVTIDKADMAQRLAGADDVTAGLAEGDRLAVFPEGTFERRAGLLPFRLGAFRAAVETGAPVVPVSIRGTRDMLPAGAWLLRRTTLTVTIGEPLTPAGGGWPEMVRLRDAARAFIARESGEPLA